MLPKLKSNPKGQALVEFALILVVLLLFIFIIVEAGRLFQGWVTVQNAARAGGRYAITGSYETDCLYEFPRCPDARVDSIKDEVRRTTSGLVIDPEAVVGTASSFDAEVWSQDPSGNWQEDNAGGPGAPIRVRASFFMPMVTPLFQPLARFVRLTGQVVVQAEKFDQYETTRGNVAPPGVGEPGDTGGTPEADLRITKTASAAQVFVGETIEYLIEVENLGPFFAEDVVVIDTLPPGNMFVTYTQGASTVQCSHQGGIVTCQMENLSNDFGPNSRASVTIETTAPATAGIITNTATVSTGPSTIDPNLPNSSSVQVDVWPVSADLAVSISDTPDPVGVSKPLTYTYIIENLQYQTANGVQLSITLPSEVNTPAIVSKDFPGACTPVSGGFDCLIGEPLPLSETRTVVVRGIVDPGAAGLPWPITTIANVSSTTNDPNLANNQASEETNIADQWADLAITKSGPSNPVSPGDTIIYELVVTNLNQDPAPLVQVTDFLPGQIQIVTATIGAGPQKCDISIPGLVTCNLGTVPVGSPTSIFVETEAVSTGIVENRATVVSLSGIFDPNFLNNTAIESTIIGGSDLTLDKRAPTFILAGQRLTYTMVISNYGPNPASTVKLVDTLPTNITGLKTPGFCSSVANGEITCDVFQILDPIPVGSAAQFSFSVIAPPQDLIVNEASVSHSTPDVNPADNSDIVTTTTTLNADVEMAKFAFTDFGIVSNIGEQIEYLLQVSSLGPSSASGIKITDTLPATTEFYTVTSSYGPDVCEYNSIDHAVYCDMGDLILGPTINVSIFVSPTLPGTITNTATVNGFELDLFQDNNTDFVETEVVPADLKITKIAPATALVSDTITYTLVITNDSRSAANNVVVTDTLPAEVLYLDAISELGTCTFLIDTVSCAIDTLRSFETTLITITVEAATIGIAVNHAETKAETTEPGEIDFADAETSISPTSDLEIKKYALSDYDDFYFDQQITYRLVITNHGPSEAVGIVLTDTIPTNWDYDKNNDIHEGPFSCNKPNAGNLLICTLASLPRGGQAEMSVTGIGDELGIIFNSAGVTSTYIDQDLENNHSENTLEVVAWTDLIVTKDDLGPFYAGETFYYFLEVTNDGPFDSPAVVLTDTIPPSLTVESIVSTDFTCTPDTVDGVTSVSCIHDGPLNEGNSGDVTIGVITPYSGTYTNTAEVTGSLPDIIPNNRVEIATTVLPVAHLSLVKVDNGLDAIAGTNYSYTITVANAGPNVAGNVTVDDILPTDTSFVSSTLGATACSGGGTITCQIGTMAKDDTVEFGITIFVEPDVISGTTLINEATVQDSETTDRDLTDNTDTEPTDVIRIADLTIAKGDGGATATAGLDFTYSITVTNNGPSYAGGIVVIDTYPVSTTLAAIGNTICTDNGNGTASCAVPTELPNNGTTTFEIVLSTDPGIADGETLTNSVVVTSNEIDDVPTNDAASEDTPVIRRIELEILKSDEETSGAEAVVSELFTYTISIENYGPSDASNIVVTDSLPAEMTYVNSSVPCSLLAGNELRCSAGDVDSGVIASFNITVRINNNAVHNTLVTNWVELSASEIDLGTYPYITSETTTILGKSDLGIEKSDGGLTAIAGEPFSYTITVSNTGPSVATNIVVEDVLPIGQASYISSSGDECDPPGSPLQCDIPDLPVNGEYTFTITVNVFPDVVTALDNLINTASVDGAQVDRNSDNDSSTVATDSKRVTELQITKTDNGEAAIAGATYTYYLDIINQGPSTASGVIVTDTLPSGMTFGSSPDNCIDSGGTIICEPAGIDLDRFTGASYEITVNVDRGVISPTTLINIARVRGNEEEDPDTANNRATEQTIVIRESNLSIVKTDGEPAIFGIVGLPYTYTISVSNLGASDASNVTVIDELPVGTSFITDTLNACSAAGLTVTCDLGDLTSDDVGNANIIDFEISMLIGPSIDHDMTITNNVSVDAQEYDPVLANNTDDEPTRVSGQSDLGILKTGISDLAIAGEPFSYTITISNSGPSPATDVVVIDNLPIAETAYVSSSGDECDPPGDPLNCTIPYIAVNGEYSFTITVDVLPSVNTGVDLIVNTATVSSDQVDLNPGNDSSTVRTDVKRVTDLEITKSDHDLVAIAGASFTYNITVTNHGPSNASGVVVSDTLPSEMSFDSSTNANCVDPEPDGIIFCDPITNIEMGPGDIETFQITVDVDRSIISPTTLINTARVWGAVDEEDPIGANNRATDDTLVQRESDLAITKNDGEPAVSAIVGLPYTYTISVSNFGDSDASNVTVVDLLPAGTSFITDSLNACSDVGLTVTCDLGILTSDDTGSANIIDFDISILIGPSVDHNTTITNNVFVDADEVDPIPGNNATFETTEVTGQSNLGILKTAIRNEAVAGEPFSYTITISNSGPSPATGITVEDILPLSNVVYVSSSGGECDFPNTPLSCVIPDLAVNGEYSFTITVDVLPAVGVGLNALVNTVNVSGDQDDLNPTNDSSIVETDVTRNTDLEITKSDQDVVAIAGASLTYYITVTNHGPSNASGVVVSDTLPSGMSFASSTNPSCEDPEPDGIIFCDPITNLEMGPGDVESFQITVDVDRNVTSPTTLFNTARVWGAVNEEDPIGANNRATDDTLVQRESDLVITKSDGEPTEIGIVGRPYTYTISVSNLGASDASNVTVVDDLPPGTSFITDTLNACSDVGLTVTCDLGDLTSDVSGNANTVVFELSILIGPSVSHNTTIINNVSVDADEMDPVPGNNSTDETTLVLGQADLSIIKTDNGNEATAGTRFTYTMTVYNDGPSQATGVTVTDTLPANTQFAAFAGADSCSEFDAGAKVSCLLSPIAAGDSLTFTLAISVPSSADPSTGVLATHLNNYAEVSGAQIDFNTGPGENDDSEFTPIVRLTDLRINKDDAGKPAIAGHTYTYTLTIFNDGPSDASGVIVSDTIPALTTFNDGLSEPSCEDDDFDGIVYCSLPPDGTISSGNQTSIDIVVNVDQNFSANGSLTNTGYVNGVEPESDYNNNQSVSVVTEVDRLADLSIDKLDTNDVAVVGEVYSYTIVVSNTGPSNAMGVVVTDTLPTDTVYKASSLGNDCSESGGGATVTCIVGDIIAGNPAISFTLYITVGSNIAHDDSIVNSAIVAGDDPDPNSDNNIASVSTRVIRLADIAISKTDDGSPAVAGGLYTYTIAVTNNGPSDATGVIVTDTLGADLHLDPSTPGCTEEGLDARCVLGNLIVNETKYVTITVEIDSSIGDGVTVTNRAEVKAFQNDPDPGNNSTTEESDVVRRVDLAIEKGDYDQDATAGVEFTYTITVTNNGPSDASGAFPSGIIVTDTLPPLTNYVSNTAVNDCVLNSGSYNCDIGELSAGSSISFTITISPSASIGDGTTINNRVGVYSDEVELDDSDNNADEDTDVFRLIDLVVNKSDNNQSAVVGQTYAYTITVTNTGPSLASGIVVTDAIPNFTSYASSSGACTYAAPDFINCPELGTNESFTIVMVLNIEDGLNHLDTITNTAGATGLGTERDYADNSDEETTLVERVSDLAIQKGIIGDLAVAGETLTYVLTATNSAPNAVAVYDVLVVDTLPVGTLYKSATASPSGLCNLVATTVECDLGLMNSGSEIVISIVVTVTADTISGTNLLNNLATIDGSLTDNNSSNDTASIFTDVIRKSDLLLIKSDDGSNAVAGDATGYAYVLQIANLGPSTASDIVISDTLPVSTTLNTDLTDGICYESGGVVYCDISELASGITNIVDIVFDVSPKARDGQIITNTASVRSTSLDEDLSNNLDSEDTTIDREADLSINKSDDGSNAVAGSVYTYTVDVTNNGPSYASGVVVTDTLDSSAMTFAWSSEPSCADQGGGTVSCLIGDIMPGLTPLSFTIAVTVESTTAQGTEISNNVEVRGNEYDPVENNTDTEPTDIDRQVDLMITKVGNGTAIAGEEYIYTINVTNNGPSFASGIVVTDTLDGAMGFVSASGPVSSIACDAAGPVCFTLNSGLAPGISQAFDVSVLLSSNIANNSTVTNIVDVGSDEPDSNIGNNTANAPTTVIRETDLAISKGNVGGSASVASLTHTYRITVTNNGPSDADGVVVTDTLPAGTFAPSINGALSSCSMLGNQYSCNADGPLAAGADLIYELTVTVNQTVEHGITITNTVLVSSEEKNDPVSTNDSAFAETLVERKIDLGIGKVIQGSDPYYAGEPITYSISIINNGPSLATGVVVTDYLPAGLLDATETLNSSDGSCVVDLPQGEIRCLLNDLGYGDTVSFGVVITPGGAGTIVNTIEIDGNEADDNVGNDSSSETDTILASADLHPSFVAPTSIPQSPTTQQISLTFGIYNYGPSVADSVTFTVTLSYREDRVTAMDNYCDIDAALSNNFVTTIVCDLGDLTETPSPTSPIRQIGLSLELRRLDRYDSIDVQGEIKSSTTHDPNLGNNLSVPATISVG